MISCAANIVMEKVTLDDRLTAMTAGYNMLVKEIDNLALAEFVQVIREEGKTASIQVGGMQWVRDNVISR
jgi:hypothetical protein